MVDISEAIAGTNTYTTAGMSFFEKRKVKKIIKIFDKEIQKAMNTGQDFAKFYISGKRYPFSDIEDINNSTNDCKELYLLKNVIHMYKTMGYKLECTAFLNNFYTLNVKINISWKDTEINDLIKKYT